MMTTLSVTKVECQSFHGDIFVGNHLAQHKFVCSVLDKDSNQKLCSFCLGFLCNSALSFTKTILSEADTYCFCY